MFLLKDTTQWRLWGSNPRPLGPESSTLPQSHCAPYFKQFKMAVQFFQTSPSFSNFHGPNTFFYKFNRPLARLQKGRKIPVSVTNFFCSCFFLRLTSLLKLKLVSIGKVKKNCWVTSVNYTWYWSFTIISIKSANSNFLETLNFIRTVKSGLTMCQSVVSEH